MSSTLTLKQRQSFFRGKRGLSLSALLAFISSLSVVASASAQTFTTLYHFGQYSNDGMDAFGGLIESGSVLYGMTYSNGSKGGSQGGGTIFQYDLASNTEAVLHNFPNQLVLNPNDGKHPFGSLIQSGTNLFGMTWFGGTGAGGGGAGAIVQYSLSSNSESVLHTFTGGGDGGMPFGSLAQSSSNLYGLTSSGGEFNDGVLFQYNLNTGQETPLHNFTQSQSQGNVNDGLSPTGSPIVSGTLLYGMARSGGANGDGAIFQYNLTTNTESTLHSFTGIDGATPLASLTQSGSMLYGVTELGGQNNLGTLFQYNLNTGQETVLYSFGGVGDDDGAEPISDLILSGSTLYGTTVIGGANNQGTVFQFDLNTDTETLLHQFTGSLPDDGFFASGETPDVPEGNLLLSGSTLYGMTPTTIFAITVPEPTSLMTLALGTILALRRRHRS